jgi:hypothetical protein
MDRYVDREGKEQEGVATMFAATEARQVILSPTVLMRLTPKFYVSYACFHYFLLLLCVIGKRDTSEVRGTLIFIPKPAGLFMCEQGTVVN